MSPEIQEWSHKSRSRINNLYLLTRHIGQIFASERGVLHFNALAGAYRHVRASNVKNRAGKYGNPCFDICAKFVGFKHESFSPLFQSFIRLSYLFI